MNTSPQGRGPGASPGEVPALAGQQTDGRAGRLGLPHRRRQLHRRRRSPSSCARRRSRPTSSSCSARRSLRGRTFSAEEDLPDADRGGRPQPAASGNRRFNARTRRRSARRSRSAASRTRSSASSASSTSAEFGPPPQVWTRSSSIPTPTDQGHYFQAAGRLEAGRHARSGADAGRGVSAERVQAQVSERARPERRLRRQAVPRRARQRTCDAVAAGARRRGQLRAADRLRQRRQPAAGARHRPPARDRHPRRDRRLARPHHPPAAHRERACSRSPAACSAWRSAWSASARCCTVNTAGLPRVGETARWSASTGACSPSPSACRSRTGILFGLIPALQSSRADLTTTLKESSGRSGTGFRQNKARSILVVDRGRARAGSADRLGAADPHRDRAAPRRSRLRHAPTC